MSLTGAASFKGNQRFEVLERLGAGAFGVVYRAFDRVRQQEVALKTVQRVDPNSIYMFKQEFRALTGVVHPNLAQFYELFFEEQLCFFTMELIQGQDFLSYIRGGASLTAISAIQGTVDTIIEASGTVFLPVSDSETVKIPGVTPNTSKPPLPLDAAAEGRLEQAFSGLVAGVRALHGASLLHRDLKPENVLVTVTGRVVLLDFGLAYKQNTEILGEASLGPGIVGTPVYMSPEQAAEGDVDEASDWYSVGVILFEALTGRPPVVGSLLKLLQLKQKVKLYKPSDRVTGVPELFDSLCCDLLQKDPRKRPSGTDIARLIEAGEGALESCSPCLPGSSVALGGTFFGREAELARLGSAYQRVFSAKAGPVLQLVTGGAGVGKSELVQHFLKSLSARDAPIVLHGRCYQQESVPYKAWDSVIDALCRFLRRLSLSKGQALLPRYLPALCRLFPVLQRVEAIAVALEDSGMEPLDSTELQRQAFVAFKDFLGRLAMVRPLVIFIDDLHWGDEDSAILLKEVFSESPPELLLLGVYREEERKRSDFFQCLDESESPLAGILTPLELKELSESEALSLSSSLLGDKSGVELIARESRGNPFLLGQLARSLGNRSDNGGDGGTLSLAEMVRLRVDRLSVEARQFAEVVALIGCPVSFRLVLKGASLESMGSEDLAVLKADHFIAVRLDEIDELVEAPHDRLARCLVADISVVRRKDLMGRLAGIFAAEPGVDPEFLGWLFEESGDMARSRAFLTQAAGRAFETLAFERAARLCEKALKLGGLSKGESHILNVQLGEALTNVGEGLKAADAYLTAALAADPEKRLDLRRRAAQQLFSCGHFARGRSVISQVAKEFNLFLPTYSKWELIKLLGRRLKLWMVLKRFTVPIGIVEEERIRVETCWVIASSLVVADSMTCFDFITRLQLYANKSGHLRYFALGLLLDSWFQSVRGHHELGTARRKRALELAVLVQDPYLDGFGKICLAFGNYYHGRWRASIEVVEEGLQIFRERCTGVHWEMGLLYFARFLNLEWLGDITLISKIELALMKEARKRGNLYLEFLTFHRARNLCCLVYDDVDKADAEAAVIDKRWIKVTGDSAGVTELYLIRSKLERFMYRGAGRDAWAFIDEQAKEIKKGGVYLSVRLNFLDLRARCALILAGQSTGAEKSRWIVEARRAAKSAVHPQYPYYQYLQDLVEAGAALLMGDWARSLSLLSSAEVGFQREEILLRWALVKRCRGLILGKNGERGIVEAEAWLEGQGVKNMERLTQFYIPGPWGDSEFSKRGGE
jgi:eukaryotic-like serine/threonine-protein kinase